MDISRSIRGFAILAGALIMAIWLGVSLVTSQSETLMQVAGASFILLCVFLGRRVWLLLMFFSALQIPLIRGFSTLEVGQMAFIGFSVLLFLMRKFNGKVSFGEPEIWMLLLAACVLQVYFRNPVGLNIFGAASVGARPYFYAALAFFTGLLLSFIKVPPGELRWAMRLTIFGTFVGIPIGEFRQASGLKAANMDSEGARMPWLNTSGQMLSRILISKMSPFQSLGRPLYLLGFIVCVLIAAASGYRNAVAYIGLLFVFGIFYYHGFASMLASLVAAALLIGILAGVNVIAPLPGTVQRALSAFPGTWDKQIVESGTTSTEWRVEMWKEALLTEYWIKNKALGDGLGMTRQEMERMQALSEGGRDAWKGRSGMSIQQENMMITGGYHSGPVHTIRIIGYVGLVILFSAMIRMAILAHRQILRCRNTEWFGLALFFCLPIQILPVFWTFIYGEFHSGFAGVAMAMGIIRLMEKNIPLPAWSRSSYIPYVLRNQRAAMGQADPA